VDESIAFEAIASGELVGLGGLAMELAGAGRPGVGRPA